ncbi:MAG: dipeptidase PepV [Atopostipes suicloacalis]|nr:dipeptidase PepV [Atopostipes suicloacalis]MDN6730886.1 dipeptidase PepV [Atopostipes suicloacalis]
MTEINWQELVADYKEDFLKDLFTLLEIDSTRDDDAATEEFPVGPGPVKALKTFLKLGERDNFKANNFDNWAGHIEFGEGEELLGIFGHVDVVPAGTGWDTDPYEPVIKDGKIYARGSSDDKGPTMAAYYAMKMIQDLELPVSKRVRLIIGTDEETGWGCMDHYLKVAETPDFGFSPDAYFPIINGEKGNITVKLDFAGENGNADQLLTFDSGLRVNMVPQEAEAKVKLVDTESVEENYKNYLNENDLQGRIEINESTVHLLLTGKAAHGSTPEEGVNAGTHLARFLSDFDFSKDAEAFLKVIKDYLYGSDKGEKLNIQYKDDLMGHLSSNFGVLKFKASEGGEVYANMRYPQGIDADEILTKIKESLKDEEVECDFDGLGKKPHYVSKEDPLVKTLLDVYERQTGLEAHEKVIGGGTYGRLLDRGVAFGAMFPDSVDTMHQANEFMAVEDLTRAMAIYAESIYELIK